MTADPQDPATWESADGHCCWLAICPACSAVVYDAPDHVAWHKRLAGSMAAADRADATTRPIGPGRDASHAFTPPTLDIDKLRAALHRAGVFPENEDGDGS